MVNWFTFTKKKRTRIPHRQSALSWFVSRTFLYEAAAAAFVFLGGIANAMRAFHANENTPGQLWVATAIGAFVFTVVRVAVGILQSVKEESSHELLGCLHVLHSNLIGEGAGDARVRATLHIPLRDGKELQQVVEYVGDDEPNQTSKVGRTMPVHVGIVGRCYRTHNFILARRESESNEDFVKELVNTWSYTDVQAEEIDKTVKCWLAVPILDAREKRVDGVVFIDSTEDGFFTDEKCIIVFASCVGIARYIAKRYK